MRDAARSRVLFIGFTLFLPDLARSQNLLTNPRFDVDLTGWTVDPGRLPPPTRVGEDSYQSPGSGSAYFFVGTVRANPPYASQSLSQCVPVEGPREYDFGGALRYVGPTGAHGLGVAFFASSDCTGPSSDAIGFNVSGDMPYQAWNWFGGAASSPAGARSARVLAYASVSGSVLESRFASLWLDSVYLRPAAAKSTPAAFHTLMPCRIVDTRDPGGLGGAQPLQSRSRKLFHIDRCQVPATARALSVNVTVTQPDESGDLRIYLPETTAPLASSINYSLGQTRANSAVVALQERELVVQCDQANGKVELIVDVTGYFE